jgi:hypothetical protein
MFCTPLLLPLALLASLWLHAQRKARLRARHGERAIRRRGKRKVYQRLNWALRAASLTDKDFRLRYRLSKAAFNDLATKIRPVIAPAGAPKSRGEPPLSVELHLHLTLRFLAGGDHKDVADMTGCSVGTFYRAMHRTIAAINIALKDQVRFPIVWKKNPSEEDKSKSRDELQHLSDQYANRSQGVLRGIVGAIDGVLIRIAYPPINGAAYMCRKKFSSVHPEVLRTVLTMYIWVR